MAPLEVEVAASNVSCDFCGAPNQVARREASEVAEDTGHAHTPIDASERYARLRSQDQQPKALSPGLGYLLDQGQLSAHRIPEAEAEWAQARKDVAVSAEFPTQTRYFELTILLAPFVEERRRRAILETALESLSNGAQRHILRCTLSREATYVGDVVAAKAWLAPVNAQSSDLALHTAHCFAAATLASLENNDAAVLSLLGTKAGDVPLANRDEFACDILRVNAMERQQGPEEVLEEVSGWLEQWGPERVQDAISHHHPLRLCERSLAMAQIQVELRQVRSEIVGHVRKLERLNAKFEWRAAFVVVPSITGFFALVLASVWVLLVSTILQKDPLFGMHAEYSCSRVCESCQAPYRFTSWNTSSGGRSSTKSVDVYCHDSQGKVAQLSDNEFRLAAIQNTAWLKQYKVEGGVWSLWFSMFLLLCVPLFLVMLMLIARGRRARIPKRALVVPLLEQARAREATLVGQVGDC